MSGLEIILDNNLEIILEGGLSFELTPVSFELEPIEVVLEGFDPPSEHDFFLPRDVEIMLEDNIVIVDAENLADVPGEDGKIFMLKKDLEINIVDDLNFSVMLEKEKIEFVRYGEIDMDTGQPINQQTPQKKKYPPRPSFDLWPIGCHLYRRKVCPIPLKMTGPIRANAISALAEQRTPRFLYTHKHNSKPH